MAPPSGWESNCRREQTALPSGLESHCKRDQTVLPSGLESHCVLQSRIQLHRDLFSPRVWNFATSVAGTMVLNAEL